MHLAKVMGTVLNLCAYTSDIVFMVEKVLKQSL